MDEPPKPPRLLDRLRDAIRVRQYSIRTEEAYVQWARRFIFFHNKKHPAAMGADEVNAFLTHLAANEQVSSSTQGQALSAILFLYRCVLEDPLPWLGKIVRARKPRRLPVVLTRDEVRSVLAEMGGVPRLVSSLLYGTGMRLLEGLRVRVKDIDFMARIVVVREGKGDKDRRTMLPRPLIEPLQQHLELVRRIHEKDRHAGFGEVWLPHTLGRKYPNAAGEWGWQYVFPAANRSRDPRSGTTRRHHLDESTIQKAVKNAVRQAKVTRPASCHSFRHCAASPVMPSRWHFTPAFEFEGRHNPALLSGLVRARIDRDDSDVSPRRSG
ncbi:MAG TPA: integron integrase [Thermoanaerobaculia bacterium]|nr:integron integrase [Thermoanaerobaculia bacterium]